MIQFDDLNYGDRKIKGKKERKRDRAGERERERECSDAGIIPMSSVCVCVQNEVLLVNCYQII